MEIGVIYRRIRMWYLCFTYTPVSTDSLAFLVRMNVVSESESMNQAKGGKTYVPYHFSEVSRFQEYSLISATSVRPHFPSLTEAILSVTGD